MILDMIELYRMKMWNVILGNYHAIRYAAAITYMLRPVPLHFHLPLWLINSEMCIHLPSSSTWKDVKTLTYLCSSQPSSSSPYDTLYRVLRSSSPKWARNNSHTRSSYLEEPCQSYRSSCQKSWSSDA